MTVYVTSLGLDVAMDNRGDAFVTALGVDVVQNPRKNAFVTSLGIDLVQNPRDNVFVTSLGIDLIQSVFNAVRPLRLESSSVISAPFVERKQDVGQPTIDNRESNPFKPSYPQLDNGLEQANPLARFDAPAPAPILNTTPGTPGTPTPAAPSVLERFTTPQSTQQSVASPAGIAVPQTQSEASPASDQILFHMMREQTEQVRQQHEKTQAGDTTMPWEFLTRLSTERLYTLGSQGRFYHDSYGMMVARYVKFDKMIPATFVNSPVGRLASEDTVSWVVTNDFARSGPDLVSGILASYSLPRDGEFGWIITCGANHTNLRLNSVGLVTQGADLVWGAQESLAIGGKGIVLGRIWGKRGIANLSPGMIFINLEGPSKALIESWFDVKFSDLTNKIVALTDRVTALESSSDYSGLIEDLQAEITALEQALREEAGTRQARDAYILGIIADMGAITQEDLDEVVTQLNLTIQNLRDAIYIVLGSLQDQINALASQVALIPFLQSRIDELQEQIGMLQSQLSQKKTYIPLVTGEIPPVFVYLDDGSLVLVEVDYDGAP